MLPCVPLILAAYLLFKDHVAYKLFYKVYVITKLQCITGHGTKVQRNVNMESLQNGYLFSEVCGIQNHLGFHSSA